MLQQPQQPQPIRFLPLNFPGAIRPMPILPMSPPISPISSPPPIDQFIPCVGKLQLPTPPADPSPAVRPGSQAATSQAAQLNPKSDEVIIGKALNLLGGIRHLPQEEAYLRLLGLNPCFHNGQEALRMIQNNRIKVVFGDMGDSSAHAQWVANPETDQGPDQPTIMVNQKYRGDDSPATLYAISEALYHEAGHAANVVTDPKTGQPVNLSILGNRPTSIGDDQSSIQEELDCMALNSLAHGYHEAIDPAYAKAASESRLLHDGVQLYYKLLLRDPDPQKNAIINRMLLKYGELPLSSPGHEITRPNEPFAPLPLTARIAQRMQQSTATTPKPPPPAVFSANIPSNLPQMAYWA
jgi:hypothetical protein